jgi:hypothetical protein
VKVGFQTVIRPRHFEKVFVLAELRPGWTCPFSPLTEHVSNIDDNGTCLSWKRSEDIAACKTRMAFSAWADFKSVFSIALEQKSKTSNISVTSGSPCSDSFFGRWIVY